MKNRKGGPKCSTSIGKLIQRNDYTMQDIADKIGVHVSTVKNYVRGKTRVTNNIIIDVAEILNNDPENIERLFDEAYDQYHIDSKRITIDDIPEKKDGKPQITKEGMTVRELVKKLLIDPNINFDQEIALGTKDGGLSHLGYILFHIKDVNNLDGVLNVLWFEDVRHKK